MRKTFVALLLVGSMPSLGCGDDTESPSGAGGMAGATAGGAGGSTSAGGSAGSMSSGGSGGSSGGGNSLCEQGCVATLEADCPNGPPTQAQCEADCEMLQTGSCGTQYQEFQACAEGETITCGAQGIPVVEACATEQTAFIDCLN